VLLPPQLESAWSVIKRFTSTDVMISFPFKAVFPFPPSCAMFFTPNHLWNKKLSLERTNSIIEDSLQLIGAKKRLSILDILEKDSVGSHTILERVTLKSELKLDKSLIALSGARLNSRNRNRF